MKLPVFVLFGPTASGKTGLLKRLFGGGAGITRAEIISADSMQVYRGMDIGTAKPSLEERAGIPHHLIDIRNPDEQFNTGEFVRLASEACFAAAGRGALPVVSGGTGFYLKNLVQGLSMAPPSDPGIRRQLKEELSGRGAVSLMAELAEADPVSASRIHVNDVYRLLRALEVFRLTGRPLSSYRPPAAAGDNGLPVPPAAGPPPVPAGDSGFRFLLAGLRWDREELYRRINLRTAAMFRAGLPGEVERLSGAGYTPADPGLRAIGYREFFVENPAPPSRETSWRLSGDLPGVEALVAQNSRRYAKRQITFFASLPDVRWIDCGDDDGTFRALLRVLEEFRASV